MDAAARLARLRPANAVVGVVHLAQAVLILLLANDFALPVVAEYQQGAPGTTAEPVNAATRGIIGALVRHGRVPRAYLGVGGGSRPLPPRAAAATGLDRGLEVLSVVPGSPAAAGVRPEDVLVRVDGIPVAAAGDLQRLMTEERIGRAVAVEVVRAGALRRLTAVPTELGR